MVPVTARPTLHVESDDVARAVADGADAVQGALDTGTVVIPEQSDMFGDVFDFRVADVGRVEDRLPVGEPRLGLAAEVEHHLEEVASSLRETLRGGGDTGRKRRKEQIELLLPRGSVRRHLGDDLSLLETVVDRTRRGTDVDGAGTLRAIPA